MTAVLAVVVLFVAWINRIAVRRMEELKQEIAEIKRLRDDTY